MGAQFTQIPDWVRDADISDGAIRLYLILRGFIGANTRGWPSRQTLAERMTTKSRTCSTRSVDRYMNELKGIRAITVQRRWNQSSLYYVWSDPPEARVSTDESTELSTEFSTATDIYIARLDTDVQSRLDTDGDMKYIQGKYIQKKNSIILKNDDERVILKQKEAKKEKYASECDQLWELYPRRLGKKPAYDAIKARLNSGVAFEDLLKATKNYAASVANTEMRFIKHPQTFFGPGLHYQDFLDKNNPAVVSVESRQSREQAIDDAIADLFAAIRGPRPVERPRKVALSEAVLVSISIGELGRMDEGYARTMVANMCRSLLHDGTVKI
jgi:hypothetical protein